MSIYAERERALLANKILFAFYTYGTKKKNIKLLQGIERAHKVRPACE